MAVVRGVRAFLRLGPSVTLRHSFELTRVQVTPWCLARRTCGAPAGGKVPGVTENESLVKSLKLMGVDLKMIRRRHPGVLRKSFTNEQYLGEFLQGKGASSQEIGSIISRYPRAIIRSPEHLKRRWELWRIIFKTDAEVVAILSRSPESFFRSTDNGNLEQNITFLTSLDLNSAVLYRLLTTAPRTFSNSVNLNQQMVQCLEDICAELGGENPQHFVKTVISRNAYLLIRSTKRIKTNVDFLRASLKLTDAELLELLQGGGAQILDTSNEYLKKNFKNLEQRMALHGCQEADLKKLILDYPGVLYVGADKMISKLDALLNGGITIEQVLKTPRVLGYSTKNITERVEELQRVGYDFQECGIAILDTSQKRFVAKIERLVNLLPRHIKKTKSRHL